MGGRNARELAKEFGAVRALRPNLGEAVYHVSLSVRREEQLSAAKWDEIANKYLAGMGFKDNQFVLIRHHDTPTHDHVHIIGNRITRDGKEVVTDSHNYKRSAQVIQAIEREYGLKMDARTPQEVDRHAPTHNELMKFERTGEISTKMRMQGMIDQAAQGQPTMTEFIRRLEVNKIQVVPNLQSTGRVAGLSYELDGKKMKGSDLGKNYTMQGIQQKLGVNYEPSRDDATIRRCHEQTTSRGTPTGPTPGTIAGTSPGQPAPATQKPTPAPEPGHERADSSVEPTNRGNDPAETKRRAENSQPERIGGTRGPDGRELGQAVGRVPGPAAPDHGRAQATDSGHAPGGPGRHAGNENRTQGDEPRRPGRTESGKPSERVEPQNVAGPSGHVSDRVRSLAAGLLDLAAPANQGGKIEGTQTSHRGNKHGDITPSEAGKSPEQARDRTTEAAQRQTEALGCDRYEVGIRAQATGNATPSRTRPMVNHQWSAAEVIANIPWLKRENALGNDIYIRPHGSQGVVLIDDLKPAALERMKADGFQPCATVETSPGNFQAWVRLSKQPIDPQAMTLAARELATRYGGDLNSADSRHYGRLAGFTNRKPGYGQENGLQPFVLLRGANQGTASKGQEFMTEINARLPEWLREKRVREYNPANEAQIRANNRLYTGIDEASARYAAIAKPMVERIQNPDWSRVDFVVARHMAEKGWSQHEIEFTIKHGSPEITTRKAGHVENYCARTAQAGLKEANRERGPETDFEIG